MNRLMLPPTEAGYTATFGGGVISQKLQGGASRFEVDVLGASHMLSLSWLTDRAGYQYLMAFYRLWQVNPSQPFIAELIIDDHQLQEYECHFMPDTMTLVGVQGLSYSVSAQIEAEAITPDIVFDQAIVDAWESGMGVGMPELERLVNVDLPDALENVESVT